MNPTTQPDYSWAEYLDYMEGGGSDVLTLKPSPAAQTTPRRTDQPIWGILAALAITLAAIWLSERPFRPFTVSGRHPIEPVMLAIVFGMVISNTFALPKTLTPGIKFATKKLLPLGIVLLGARLNFFDLVKVGAEGLALSFLETLAALLLLLAFTYIFRLPHKLGALLGVGTAICGGTAIVATAPVIEADEKDVVFSVATVTLLGLIAMFTLPFLGHAFELSSKAFGVWAGLAIHQTPQVIASGFAYSDEAGATATVVKLARVCLLAPVVFLIGLFYKRRQIRTTGSSEKKRINYLHLFPTFVVGFLAVALLNTGGLLPKMTFHMDGHGLLKPGNHPFNLAGFLDQISKFCITVSMAAVGLETRFSAMRQTGLKPFAASLGAVVVLASMILFLIRFLNL